MKTISLVLAFVLLVSTQSVFSQQVKVDTEKSKVKWTGSKIGGSHNGEIKLKSGEMELKGDQIVKGNFVMDMNTITNTDLDDKGSNQKLVGHLKSDDFFGVDKFPTSTLVIKNSTKFVNNKAKVTGDLTIKGKTQEVTFDVTRNNKTYTSKVEVDRSKYDVRYGSKSFFDNLGNKSIDDNFILDITLVTL
jgi:polyisoprenoid-binding protein YceI